MADHLGAHENVGGIRIGAQRLVIDRLIAVLRERTGVRAHEQSLEFAGQALLLLRSRFPPIAAHRQRGHPLEIEVRRELRFHHFANARLVAGLDLRIALDRLQHVLRHALHHRVGRFLRVR